MFVTAAASTSVDLDSQGNLQRGVSEYTMKSGQSPTDILPISP